MFKLVTTCCGALFVFASAACAESVPQSVKDACRGDYEKHCSQHAPESPGVRDCMAAAFDKLSDPCVGAILDSNLDEQHSAEAAHGDTAPQKAVAGSKSGNKKVARSASHKRYADGGSRQTGKHRGISAGKVAGYINRGTRIANFYVSRAFARAFR